MISQNIYLKSENISMIKGRVKITTSSFLVDRWGWVSIKGLLAMDTMMGWLWPYMKYWGGIKIIMPRFI